ncbi:carboxylate-amine ligase [Saccharothrix coeruleofusca]|uniref:Putative glutamate--cysteine ligase 2 n=1 Tax=Saccharothrix coeruleofusca TaxID=33919 RepID=A0A918EE09_9PSEU|nr:glutamate--cysteine ligase [Saccharothrix coeruleofusca]MBP2337741.1 carboxylate-amine ligase [Saccharothrix coeruleofusca]GGP61944.1 putative glutamate--cysteine ligase 2 [Saccharothrix coeruleofusca]
MSEADTALPQPRTPPRTGLTIGVEEEFLLVDATSGELVPIAHAVLDGSEAYGLDLQAEMTRYQVESATAVCRTTDEVRDQLLAGRRALTGLAARHGARIVATGAPVRGGRRPPPLTDEPRYHRIETEFGALVDGLTICGCHVHVGLPDEQAGVLISNHLRQWLPVLLALSANSPFFEGRDTGYASWRYLAWSLWPSAGPPPWLDSVEDYRQATRALLASGAALDEAMVYWDVRLSARHPTVELRVCDVMATAEEAVLLAALVRGLAAVAVAGVPAHRVPDRVLRAALWRSARDGLEGAALDVRTGQPVPAVDAVRALVDLTRPALREAGDEALVDDGVRKLLLDGTGAARQRRAVLMAAAPQTAARPPGSRLC